MVVTLLTNDGPVLREELSYEMLYTMFENINDDLKGALEDEKNDLIKLFKNAETDTVSAEKAVVNHSARITSYTNTAMFHTRQAGV